MSAQAASLAAHADGPPAAATATARLPLLPALYVVSAMLPQGIDIRPGGILLTAPRLVLLAALPSILMRLARGRRPGFQFGTTDALVVLAGAWMFIAVTITQGIARAVIGANVMILELCGGYFLMRVYLSRPGEAAEVARLLATVIAIDGVLSVMDVIAQRPVLHDLANSLSGFEQPWQRDYRHGLMRALGMQEHPIQLGNVCAFGAVLAATLMRRWRRALVLLGCLIGLVAANSSAPTMALLLAFGFLAYHKVLAPLRWRWQILGCAMATAFAALFLLHPSPFSFLIMHTAAVPQDGFYRLLIWNVVGPLVMARPLFGLGLESDFAQQFHVNNTIDCFWLASSVNFGIVGSLLFALILLTSCLLPLPPHRLSVTDARLGRALGLIMLMIFLIGITVHFWGTVWLLLAVFAAMRRHLGDLCAPRGAVRHRQ